MSVVELLDLATFAAAGLTPVPADERGTPPSQDEKDEWDAETIDELPEDWAERWREPGADDRG